MTSSKEFIYAWGNNQRRAELKGRSCRIIARGRMNSVLVEFENGERVVTSRRALRPVRIEQGQQLRF